MDGVMADGAEGPATGDTTDSKMGASGACPVVGIHRHQTHRASRLGHPMAWLAGATGVSRRLPSDHGKGDDGDAM